MLWSILRDLRSGTRRSNPDSRRPSPPEPISAADQIPRFSYLRGGRIVAFVSGSEGDALREHTVEMLKPLQPHSAGISILDFRNPTWPTELESAAREPVWFAVSPFGGGEFFSMAGGGSVNPWADAGIPFVRLYGDLPAYLPSRHLQHFPGSINAYGHAEHQEFFTRWFVSKAPSVWLPLFPFDTIPREDVNHSAKARSGLIVFPKNGNSPEQLGTFWRTRLPSVIATVLDAVAEEAVAEIDKSCDLIAAIRRHFAALSIDLSGHKHVLFFLVAQLDDYLRRVKSTMIVRSLLDLPVTIRGVNWEHVDFGGRRARHEPASDYVRTRSLLDQAIAIVDMSPNTERGPHDRVLRAAGRFTTFFTNRSQFYDNHFRNAGEFTFHFNRSSIHEHIDRALSKPVETVDMGLEQGTRMRELLTEERYVEQVLGVVDACAMALQERPDGTQNYVAFQPIG